MKVLITWFIIIFINTVSILYVVLRLFPGLIIDAAADNGTQNIFSLSYFAIITLLTIGYGDIVPRGIGRFAVSMTSLIGAFYMIIAVASIISVSDSNKK